MILLTKFQAKWIAFGCTSTAKSEAYYRPRRRAGVFNNMLRFFLTSSLSYILYYLKIPLMIFVKRLGRKNVCQIMLRDW